MTAQLLIYESVVHLSAARHRDASVEVDSNYGFSGKTNSVPLMAVEFPHAAGDYAIVFAGTPDSVMPAVILGVRENENLYLSKKGQWDAKYIPAFVRRYPFVFSNSPDDKKLILCIDESFSGFNREGLGEKLFRHDGKPTAYVENILNFLQNYQAQFARTRAFCDKVRELGLLEPMQAQVETPSGEKLSLSGFMAVNRAKLKTIPSDKLAELAKSDELELLYLHLQSMRNFQTLPGRLAVVRGDGAEPAPAKEAEDKGAEPAPAKEAEDKGAKPKASRAKA